MSVWKSDEKLLIFASVISLLKSFCLRSNITHSTQCFMTRWDTSKLKNNTPLCIIFQLSSRCFPWRWNTASYAWWITSRSRMSLHSVSFFIMFCSPDSYFVPWICFHSLLHLKFLYLGTTLIWSGKAYEK